MRKLKNLVVATFRLHESMSELVAATFRLRNLEKEGIKMGKSKNLVAAAFRLRILEKEGMKMKLRNLVLLVVVGVCMLAVSVFSAVPLRINYQGRYAENGTPVTGTRTFVFKIVDSDGEPPLYWSSGDVEINLQNGLFNYVLEPTGVNWREIEPYFEVTVAGTTLSPRERINASAYAIYASSASYAFTALQSNENSTLESGVTLFIDGEISTTGEAVTISTNVVVEGKVSILETGSSPTYYTIVKGGDQGGNITYTLPTSGGSSGNILTTDDSGNLSWTSTGAGDVTAASNITDNRVVRGDGGAKGVQESLVTIDDTGHVFPYSDSAQDLGTSTTYWANTYTDRLYLNPTAYLGGATASEIGSYADVFRWRNSAGTGKILGDIANAKIYPATTLTGAVGSSSYYWLEGYIQKLYLNSTAYLDGGGAGVIAVTGNITLPSNGTVSSAATYYGTSGQGYFRILSSGGVNYLQSTDSTLAATQNMQIGGYAGGAITTLTLNATNTVSNADSTQSLGSSGNYWQNTYTDRLYLNSTAYLDGATAGVIISTGSFVLKESDSSTSAFNNQSVLSLQNTDSTTNNWGGIQFNDAGGTIATGIGTQITDQTNHYGELAFFTRGSNGWGQRMKIGSAGGVNLGTATSATTAGQLGLDRLYLNSSVYLDGATAGTAALYGILTSSKTTAGAQTFLKVMNPSDSGSATADIDLSIGSGLNVNSKWRLGWDGSLFYTALQAGGTEVLRAVNNLITLSVPIVASGGTFTMNKAGTNAMEIGDTTGSNYAYLDLKGDTTYTDYGLRIIRYNTGPNAQNYIMSRGTGPLILTVVEAGPMVFATNNTTRVQISTAGAVNLGTATSAWTAGQLGLNRLYLNSGAYLDGASANNVTVSATHLDVDGIIHGQHTAGSGDVLYIGNDSKLVDIDVAHTAGLYSGTTPTQGSLKLGSSGPTLAGSSTAVLSVSGAVDLGDSTSLEVPNGTAPTVDAEGEMAWETDVDKLWMYDGAAAVTIAGKTKYFSIVIEQPTAADDFHIIQFPRAVTITGIIGLCAGGTNIVGCLDEMTTTGGGPAAPIDTTDWTITTVEYNGVPGEWENPSLDAGDWLRWHTTSVQDAVSFFTLTVEYYEQ